MNTALVVAVVVVLIIASKFIDKSFRKPKLSLKYHYKHKDFLMTKSENEFFDIICESVGSNYYVFPQMHLSSFIDHRVRNGQSWGSAFAHINQKSVDYVICDRKYRRPLLAIELDDSSHILDSRQKRDYEVETILKEAGVPLLRFKEINKTSNEGVAERIRDALPGYTQHNVSTDTVL